MTKVFENEQKALDFIVKLRTETDKEFNYSYKYLKVYNNETRNFDNYVELIITF